MEVDGFQLNVQIAEVFNVPDKTQGENTMAVEESHEYAVFIVQEDELNHPEGDNLFEDPVKNPLETGLEQTVKENTCANKLNNAHSQSHEGKNDGNILVEKDERLIIGKSKAKKRYLPAEEFIPEKTVVDKSNDSECILISDDEEVPASANKKRNHMKEIPEVTEEAIMKEFCFEEENNFHIEEQWFEGPAKTVVRHTAEGYHCPLFCTFSTKEQPLIIKHLMNHKKSVISNNDQDDSAYVCPLCPFMTFYHSSFVRHICYHKKTPYCVSCSKCSFKANSTRDLRRHTAWKHGTLMTCQRCPYKTMRQSMLKKHEERCKGPKKFNATLKCRFEPCPFTAPTEENLKTHEWIQHQVGSSKICNYKCPLTSCYFETFRKDLFNEHVEMHSGEELSCKLCSFKTSNFNRFKEHILLHISVP